MSTKYMVIVVRPKAAMQRQVEIISANMTDSGQADGIKNSYIGHNPGTIAANVQKITYTDTP